MFNEYDFLNFCEDRYLHEFCDQEEAVRLQESGDLSEVTRGAPAWKLVCWLGEFMHKPKD